MLVQRVDLKDVGVLELEYRTSINLLDLFLSVSNIVDVS